ncbi:MAG TPA: hypothetical protein VNQ33_11605, partial [Acidimicrobiales bacterium]|nr:hypothetical protein [Acidimicrobiales bacterium]
MSLRARLLLGMAVVAVVLVVASLSITRATEHNLIRQVDQQLARSGPQARQGNYGSGGQDGGPPSALYIARFNRRTGELNTLYLPSGTDSASPPDLTFGQATEHDGRPAFTV